MVFLKQGAYFVIGTGSIVVDSSSPENFNPFGLSDLLWHFDRHEIINAFVVFLGEYFNWYTLKSAYFRNKINKKLKKISEHMAPLLDLPCPTKAPILFR